MTDSDVENTNVPEWWSATNHRDFKEKWTIAAENYLEIIEDEPENVTFNEDYLNKMMKQIA